MYSYQLILNKLKNTYPFKKVSGGENLSTLTKELWYSEVHKYKIAPPPITLIQLFKNPCFPLELMVDVLGGYLKVDQPPIRYVIHPVSKKFIYGPRLESIRLVG